MKMTFFLTGLTTALLILGLFLSAEADTIIKPYDFTGDTSDIASELNDNFDTVYGQVNKVGSMITVDDIYGRVGIGTIPSLSTIFEIANDFSITGIPAIVSIASYYDSGTAHPAHLTGRKARGNIDIPSPTLGGDHLFLVGARGYNDATGFNHRTNASINFFATEDFTSTTMGTDIRFVTTQNGTSLPVERMRIDHKGFVGIGTQNPQNQLEVASDGINHITSTSYHESGGPGGSYMGRRARGTMSSPSAVLAEDRLARFGGYGYGENSWGGSLQGPPRSRASMDIHAAEDWTDFDHGTFISFRTTLIGETTSYERMRISDSGKVGIGTSDPQSSLQVAGYAQLDVTGGLIPPAEDCDEASEFGRMMVDEIEPGLYICANSGWNFIKPSKETKAK